MFTVKIEGFKELDQALNDLPKRLGKDVLRRALLKAGEPVKQAAIALCSSVRSGGLKESIEVSTKLTKSQAKMRVRAGIVEVFIGPQLPGGWHGHLVEFGTGPRYTKKKAFRGSMPARPFMRPAWDATKDEVLKIFTEEMRNEISKSVKRLVKKYNT